MELDVIYNRDCIEGIKELPDKSIDLIIMDPPYAFQRLDGGGGLGSTNRDYYGELTDMANGITNDMLDIILKKMKAINIYIWCNKSQLRQFFDYFEDRGCFVDLLTWHKTNPIPTCSQKYLSDTEYLFFAKEQGVKIYGSYETKRKWYVSSLNTDDKKRYGHPTVKPLDIIKNLIINSSNEGDVVLDPFIGSGTTAVASKLLNRHYIGYEINPEYHKIAVDRVKEVSVQWF